MGICEFPQRIAIRKMGKIVRSSGEARTAKNLVRPGGTTSAPCQGEKVPQTSQCVADNQTPLASFPRSQPRHLQIASAKQVTTISIGQITTLAKSSRAMFTEQVTHTTHTALRWLAQIHNGMLGARRAEILRARISVESARHSKKSVSHRTLAILRGTSSAA